MFISIRYMLDTDTFPYLNFLGFIGCHVGSFTWAKVLSRLICSMLWFSKCDSCKHCKLYSLLMVLFWWCRLWNLNITLWWGQLMFTFQHWKFLSQLCTVSVITGLSLVQEARKRFDKASLIYDQVHSYFQVLSNFDT